MDNLSCKEMQMLHTEVIQGDCLEVLRGMPDCSVDAIVTDPPSGINFMNLEFDSDRGGRDNWIAWLTEIMSEALRVIKPGGHALVWSFPRTAHWTATALENAGWEIRDGISSIKSLTPEIESFVSSLSEEQREAFLRILASQEPSCVLQVFGSGFPKSLSIDKAIDKMLGANRDVIGSYRVTGNALTPTSLKGGTYSVGAPNSPGGDILITAPATEEAKRFQGWGTALKPAIEIWWLCRRPLSEPTVASNVLRWGTGGIHVDACRVGTTQTITQAKKGMYGCGSTEKMRELGFRPYTVDNRNQEEKVNPPGRWPTNCVFSHSPGCLPRGEKKVKGCPHLGQKNPELVKQYGGGIFGGGLVTPSGGYANEDGTETVQDYLCEEGCPIKELDSQSEFSKGHKNKDSDGRMHANNKIYGEGKGWGRRDPDNSYDDAGSVSRFFPTFEPEIDVPFLYCAKASRSERDAGLDCLPLQSNMRVNAPRNSEDEKFASQFHNPHPTVKPLKLCSWLCRLITPPGGTVLDPFMGSGSIGCAAVLEGFNYIGIDKDGDYCEIARKRIEYWKNHKLPEKRKTVKPKTTVKESVDKENVPTLFEL